jgi:L-alanine-DL-glutamate epimerase-like enolase superfamily enzyme
MISFGKMRKGNLAQWGDQSNYMSYGNTLHPFTQIQITDKGLDELAKLVDTVRGMLGYDIPLATDHYGHFDFNNGIRLGKAVEKYRLACLKILFHGNILINGK